MWLGLLPKFFNAKESRLSWFTLPLNPSGLQCLVVYCGKRMIHMYVLDTSQYCGYVHTSFKNLYVHYKTQNKRKEKAHISTKICGGKQKEK